MELFDKHDIPPGDWPKLDEGSRSFLSIFRRLTSEHDLTEGTGDISNAGCIEFYRQMSCRRIIDLTEATVLLWKAQLQVPCLLQVRALLETVVNLNYFVRGIGRFDPKNDWQKLHDFITSVAFATRDREKALQRESGMATNIVTQMNSLPSEYSDMVKDFYEIISDYCHPNGLAMYQRYGDIIDQRFLAMPSDHNREKTFVAVQNTAHLLIFADSLMSEIDETLEQVRSHHSVQTTSREHRT